MSKITVLRSNVSKPAGKNYQVVELAYKTDDNKTKGMKIFGFGAQKENASVAGAAKPGDVLEVTFQQNDKGYWEFGSVKATGETAEVATSEASAAKGSAPASKGGNWETSDERAARQVMIVRQSSLSTAVALKPKATVEEVIATAQQFEAYVMGKEVKAAPTGEVA